MYQRTKIDRWFLNHIADLLETERLLRACPALEAAPDDLLWRAKQEGFSDQQLAHLWHTTEPEVRRVRKGRGVEVVYKCVDTCAAEFEAYTPYYYSSYERPARNVATEDTEDTEKKREGPNPHSSSVSSVSSVAIPEDEVRAPVPGKDRILILTPKAVVASRLRRARSIGV